MAALHPEVNSKQKNVPNMTLNTNHTEGIFDVPLQTRVTLAAFVMTSISTKSILVLTNNLTNNLTTLARHQHDDNKPGLPTTNKYTVPLQFDIMTATNKSTTTK